MGTMRVQYCVQRGQALVLSLIIMGVLSLALLRYFHVGQIVAAKARQLHALDAASYSAALVQARMLNMMAYLNRAQAGHQIAMAHLTALGAWVMLGKTQAAQLLHGNPPLHLITMQFGPAHGKGYAASKALLTQGSVLHDALMRAHAKHDRTVHHVLQTLQTQIAQAIPAARMQTLRQVIAQNYGLHSLPEDARLEIRHDTWPGYLHRQSAKSLLPFFESVARLYPFLLPRNKTEKNLWPVSRRCPWRRHELRRRGDTALDASGQWQSQDTLSFHALRSNRWIGCYHREYPMGWAWVPEEGATSDNLEHVEAPPENFSEQDFWRWVQEHTKWNIFSGSNNSLANSRATTARVAWSGMGVGFYHDVHPSRRQDALRFDTYLVMPGPDGQAVHTTSAARTFYAVPPGAHGNPSINESTAYHLFDPYWQATLATPAHAVAGAKR